MLLSYCKEIENDGLEDLMNDIDIGMMKRMAVGSASHSMAGAIGHEEILKKVRVEGVQLSVIRQLQRNPDSLKWNGEAANLSTPLLKKINVVNENNDKKTTLYEMKQSLNAKTNV